MSNKAVLYSEEARQKLLSGVKKVTKAVSATLGPRGRTVVIAQSQVIGADIVRHPIKATKDGVTVARAFSLTDHIENVGVELIKEAASKTVSEAGDATTTTCILAEAMIEKGVSYVNQPSSYNPMEIKKGMEAATKDVVDALKSMSTPVAGSVQRVKQVATVSANNDEEIGKILAEAYEAVGDEGVINIEDAKGVDTRVRVTQGFSFDSGYISPQFIRDWSKRQCVFPDEAAPNNIRILLYDRAITKIAELKSILEKVVKINESLVIIAPDIDGEALAFLAINNERRALAAVAIRAPFRGEDLNEAMEDIAALTGATYLSQLKGIKLENAEVKHLGTAKKVIVTKDQTTIIGGDEDKTRKTELVERLQANKKEAKTDEEKYAIEARLARLNGAVAVIEVGGVTAFEQKEKKDRIEDAVLSVKAAISEGFIVGGGTALLRIKARLMYDNTQTMDFRKGQEVVFEALEKPFLKICENAGVDGAAMTPDILGVQNFNFGYNANTESVEDLVETGIIDATKVIRSAVVNAASVAGTLITSECLIVDLL
jgi:chaperonin GroEL